MTTAVCGKYALEKEADLMLKTSSDSMKCEYPCLTPDKLRTIRKREISLESILESREERMLL